MGSKDSFVGVIGGSSSDMFFSSFAEQEVMSLINVVYGYTLSDAGTQHTRPETTMHCRFRCRRRRWSIAFCKLFVMTLLFMSWNTGMDWRPDCHWLQKKIVRLNAHAFLDPLSQRRLYLPWTTHYGDIDDHMATQEEASVPLEGGSDVILSNLQSDTRRSMELGITMHTLVLATVEMTRIQCHIYNLTPTCILLLISSHSFSSLLFKQTLHWYV